MRRRTSSRASNPPSAGSSSPTMSRHVSTTSLPPPVRPMHRPRAPSSASFSSHKPPSLSSAPSGDFSASTSSVFPDILRNTSQKGLEKVLNSRLVETFITITLPTSDVVLASEHADHPPLSSPATSRHASPSRPTKEGPPSKNGNTPTSKGMSRRGTVGATARSHSPVKQSRHAPSPSVPSAKSPLTGHGKSASVSLVNGKVLSSPAVPSSPKTRFPTPSALTSLATPQHTRSPPATSDLSPLVPDYISSIHWPSTNPVFQLSRYEFAPGTDLSGTRLRVDVWGRTGQEGLSGFRRAGSLHRPMIDSKGKGKAKQLEEPTDGTEWKVLESWDVALSDMKLLPDDVSLPCSVGFSCTYLLHYQCSLFPAPLTCRSIRS